MDKRLFGDLVESMTQMNEIVRTERATAAEKLQTPYGEWCRNPKACAGKGYCPLDPTCGD